MASRDASPCLPSCALEAASASRRARADRTKLCRKHRANLGRSRAHSSAGERSLHTREVPGSIPGAPTRERRITRRFAGGRRESCPHLLQSSFRMTLREKTYGERNSRKERFRERCRALTRGQISRGPNTGQRASAGGARVGVGGSSAKLSMHQKMRRKYASLVASGRAFCTRCGEPIEPGEPGTSTTTILTVDAGSEHSHCNRGAANKLRTSRDW